MADDDAHSCPSSAVTLTEETSGQTRPTRLRSVFLRRPTHRELQPAAAQAVSRQNAANQDTEPFRTWWRMVHPFQWRHNGREQLHAWRFSISEAHGEPDDTEPAHTATIHIMPVAYHTDPRRRLGPNGEVMASNIPPDLQDALAGAMRVAANSFVTNGNYVSSGMKPFDVAGVGLRILGDAVRLRRVTDGLSSIQSQGVPSASKDTLSRIEHFQLFVAKEDADNFNEGRDVLESFQKIGTSLDGSRHSNVVAIWGPGEYTHMSFKTLTLKLHSTPPGTTGAWDLGEKFFSTDCLI